MPNTRRVTLKFVCGFASCANILEGGLYFQSKEMEGKVEVTSIYIKQFSIIAGIQTLQNSNLKQHQYEYLSRTSYFPLSW